MFVVTVQFEIIPARMEEFRHEMLRQAANSLTREVGCRQFDVCFDSEAPTRCFLYEKYDDRAAFEAHLASEHFRQFDATVASWVVSKTVGTWRLDGC